MTDESRDTREYDTSTLAMSAQRLPPPSQEDVASLIAEAEERARRQVCAELAAQRVKAYRDAVTAWLVRGHDAGRIRTSPEPKTVTHTSTGARATATDSETRRIDGTAWYVYGIARDGSAIAGLDEVRGIDDSPVEFVSFGDLATATSEVGLDEFRRATDQPDLSPGSWLVTALHTHEAVVESLASAGGVLPFRFGAIYPSHDAIREILRSHAPVLQAELRRLAGASEWGVKVFRSDSDEYQTEPAAPREQTQEPEAVGTAWMQRRREEMAARRTQRQLQAKIVDALHSALSDHAMECVVRSSSEEKASAALVFDAVYLVADSEKPGFDKALHSVAADLESAGLRAEVTGPWPPYHFAQLPPDLAEHAREESTPRAQPPQSFARPSKGTADTHEGATP